MTYVVRRWWRGARPAPGLRGRDAVVPLLLVAAQSLWWPMGPWWLGAAPDLRGLGEIGPLTLVAAGALVYRRHAPEAASAAALVVTVWGLLSLGSGAGTPGVRAADHLAGPLALVVTLFALTVHRTAVSSSVGCVLVPPILAGVAAAGGSAPRAAAGAGVLAGAGCAAVWALGRLRRRIRAERRLLREYETRAYLLPVVAAAAERRRVAHELHDVAAHRLTEIVVDAQAALRLDDPQRRIDAVTRAAAAGRRAVDELDRLLDTGEPPRDARAEDIDSLVGTHAAATYVRGFGHLPPALTSLAYRVVREALTNVARYAAGAATAVRLIVEDDTLVVSVADTGGHVAVRGVGSGRGLAGLQDAVRSAGGTLHAGPHDTGWQVRAEIPVPRPTIRPRRSAARRARIGAAVRDRALVVLVAGLSLGVVLLPSDDDTDLLAAPVHALWVLIPLVAHASALAWRRLSPGRASAAALVLLAGWVGASLAGWTGLDPAELFLWSWWVELTLLHSLGAYRPRARHAWSAPAALTLVGGVALGFGPGIHGNHAGAAAVLAVPVALLAFGTWSTGRLVAARRRDRHAAAERIRDDRRRQATAAAALARSHLAAGLRSDARQHAVAAVASADEGRLGDVVTHARAALVALRALLADDPVQEREPPPGLFALPALAARRRATVTVAGTPRPLTTAVEASAYRAASILLTDGCAVEVRYEGDGLVLEIRRAAGAAPADLRELRRVVDEAEGTVVLGPEHGTVQLWLPEFLR